MIVGVLSDTHSLLLPPRMLEAFKGVDLIIHAGDVCDASVLKELSTIAPVKAVQGNMDEPALKKKLPLKEILELEGVKIGIAHGHVGIKDALGNVQEIFKNDSVQMVIFGHSHQPLQKTIGSTIYFNPGSPNDMVRAPYCSYGKIQISKGSFKAEIIKL